MEDWKGVVVSEGLTDPGIINRLRVHQAAISRPRMVIDNDGGLGRGHLYYITATKDEVDTLQKHIMTGWFALFRRDNRILVVFKDRTFELPFSDRGSWTEAVEHGMAQGIARDDLEFSYDVHPFMRRIVRPEVTRHRVMTAGLRVLPDFIIIGSQRCGTTSMYNYLVQHPAIIPSFRKEIHYFDTHYHHGLKWYKAHFPTVGRRLSTKLAKGAFATGEASPYYLIHPLSPKRIKSVMPDVKLIAMLRNPVDRSYSNYIHQLMHGFEKLPFAEAVDLEEERLRGEEKRMAREPEYLSYNHKHYSYLARSAYADQLERWYKEFPKEQILVLKSEDMYLDPPGMFDRIVEFVGLPEAKLKDFKAHNIRHYSGIDPSLRERLVDHFEPRNKRLYSMIGEDFGWD